MTRWTIAAFALATSVPKAGGLEHPPPAVRSATDRATSLASDSSAQSLDRELRDLQAVLKIPGMSVAVVHDERIVWARGYGYADVRKRTAATRNTAYPIASITKTFSAVLALQLAEKGLLNLDDPIRKYSSDFKNDSVTVRQILSHTSEDPQHRYRYSGQRFWYTTRVVETSSGNTMEELLTTRILEPVHMVNTLPGLASKRVPQKRADAVRRLLAVPYVLYGTNQLVRAPYPPSDLNASAGIVSTVVDLAAYSRAIDQNVLLSTSSSREILKPAISDDGRVQPYALGWFVQQSHGVELVWHHGSLPAFSSLIVKVPTQRLAFILLANSDALSHPFPRMEAEGDVLQSAFATAFLRAYVFRAATRGAGPLHWSSSSGAFEDELELKRKRATDYAYEHEAGAYLAISAWLDTHRKQERREIAVNAQMLRPLVGQYRFDDGYTVSIFARGATLWNQGPDEEPVQLFPSAKDEFFLKVADVQIVFERNASGAVTDMVTRQGGQEYRARRVQ